MSFHVFSMDFLLISNLGGVTLAEKAPCNRENKYEKFLVEPVAMFSVDCC